MKKKINKKEKNDEAEESNTRKGRTPANIAKSNRDPVTGVTMENS